MHGKEAAGEVTDPVCGMKVDIAGAAGSSEYNGRNFYFCSTGCKQSFDREPGRYAGGAQPGPLG